MFSFKSKLKHHIKDRHVIEISTAVDIEDIRTTNLQSVLQNSVGREKAVEVPEPQFGICSNEDSDEDDDLDEFIAVEGAEEPPEAEIVTLN